MKHIKTFEQYQVNEEFWSRKEITDDMIEKYMTSHAGRKKVWSELLKNPEKMQAMKNFLKKNRNYVLDDEILIAKWDDEKKEFTSGGKTSWSPY